MGGSGESLSNYSLGPAEGSLCSGREMWLFEGAGSGVRALGRTGRQEDVACVWRKPFWKLGFERVRPASLCPALHVQSSGPSLLGTLWEADKREWAEAILRLEGRARRRRSLFFLELIY